MKLLLLQPTCSALVSCLHGMRRKRSRSVPALMRFICRCLDLGEQPFKCNHELMIKGRRCCIFAYAQSSDIESPALLGCRCPIDGNYPATLIKSGSKDNDLLRKPRTADNSACGVDFQTVNVNDDFWDQWARRKGCGLQVVCCCDAQSPLFVFNTTLILHPICSRCLPSTSCGVCAGAT